MNTEFRVKTTDQLTRAEICGLTKLFELVFGKPCSEDLFHRKYACNPTRGSIHSLMFIGDQLAGAFSAIPVPYRFFGRTVLFAITADLMIDPAQRGPVSHVRRLSKSLHEALARDGVAFVFCCLRDEVFRLHHAVSGWRPIGKVPYYVAPFPLPARVAVRSWVAARSRVGTRSGVGVHSRVGTRSGVGVHSRNRFSLPDDSTAQDESCEIEKVNDAAFTGWRYGIFPVQYKTVAVRGGSAVYLIDPYYPIAGIPRGLRVGLLLDVSPLTEANFDDAVRAIRARERGLHALAWHGALRFRPRETMQIPARFERQPWTLGGRILIPDQVDERVFDVCRWNINLSNGDLV